MSYGNSNYGPGGDQPDQGDPNQGNPDQGVPNQGEFSQGGQPYNQPAGNYAQPTYNQPPYNQPPQQAYAAPDGGYGGVQAYGYFGGYDAAHPPRPSVGFVEAAKLFFKNYANFYGRASRSEYWWMALWGLILGVVFWLLTLLAVLPSLNNGELGPGFVIVIVLMIAVGLALVIPSLAVQVRRLHDAGFSGFFVLFRLVGLDIVPLIMCLMPSQAEGVRFDNPDGSQPATA